MATAILCIRLGHPHATADMDKAFPWLMSEGLAYLRSQEGKAFERMEMLALTAHASDLMGLIVLFGERAKLDELRRTDAFEAFSMNMGRRFTAYGVVPGVNWEGMQAVQKRIQ